MSNYISNVNSFILTIQNCTISDSLEKVKYIYFSNTKHVYTCIKFVDLCKMFITQCNNQLSYTFNKQNIRWPWFSVLGAPVTRASPTSSSWSIRLWVVSWTSVTVCHPRSPCPSPTKPPWASSANT